MANQSRRTAGHPSGGSTNGQAPPHPHVRELHTALDALDVSRLEDWGRRLAGVLPAGGRLLVAGNGGSAAEAQHLTAELVGRFQDERAPMSAIALHAETSALTAIGNDYGYDEVFARQVRAHGRPRDVLVVLSTSGRSANLVRAVDAARELGLRTWGLVGVADSPLARRCDETVVASGPGTPSTATVQETHLVAVHLLCATFDAVLAAGAASTGAGIGATEPAAAPPTRATARQARAAHRPGPSPWSAQTPGTLTPDARPEAARPPAGGAPAVAAPCSIPAGRSSEHPLVVVGDTLLDVDVVGRVERLVPGAPAPVLDALADHPRPGGAGLAALLAARAGHRVVLVTALGADAAGRRVRALLAEAGIEVVDLGLRGPTPRKVRFQAGGQTLMRLDRGGVPASGHDAGGDARRAEHPVVVGTLPADGLRALGAARAVLVSDYGRGLVSSAGVRAALADRMGRLPVVWDPHPRGDAPLPGTRMVTPNAAEARLFASDGGRPGRQDTPSRQDAVREAAECGRRLVASWRVATVAVTLGERGAVLVDTSGAPPLVAPPLEAVAGDTCGAGDMFAVSAAASLARGALPSEAMIAATEAASAFVAAGAAFAVRGAGRPDSAAEDVTLELLAGDHHAGGVPAGGEGTTPGAASQPNPPVAAAARRGDGLEQAMAVARRTRGAGGTVVATGGCFDLLHAGHVEVLATARQLGDCLIVCLNSDDSVRRLKGAARPLVPAVDRAAVLRGLGSVDAVAVFDEDTPTRLLAELRPDIFAKGGDYAVADLPEAEILAAQGGQAVVLPYLDGRSTTSIIREAVRRGGH